MSEYKLSMTASEIDKALGNALATNFFELDTELADGGEDACGNPVSCLAFTNMEQVKNAIDNNMIITVVYSHEYSGAMVTFERRYFMHIESMIQDCDSTGTMFFVAQPMNASGIYSAYELITVADMGDYHKGIITPASAKIRIWSNGQTLVKVYAAPF